MKIIGLTGGIGMGKSTAAAAFRRAGVPVFDADATVHELQSRHGRAIPLIARAFPGTVANGVLNRAELRRIVLADRADLHRLEKILHPLVRAAQRRFLARARGQGAPMVVLDIPLLFETGGHRAVDHVVVVSAPAKVQQARVRARRRMSDSQIAAILAAQTPDAVKRAQADTIVLTGFPGFMRSGVSSDFWRASAPPQRTHLPSAPAVGRDSAAHPAAPHERLARPGKLVTREFLHARGGMRCAVPPYGGSMRHARP